MTGKHMIPDPPTLAFFNLCFFPSLFALAFLEVKPLRFWKPLLFEKSKAVLNHSAMVNP